MAGPGEGQGGGEAELSTETKQMSIPSSAPAGSNALPGAVAPSALDIYTTIRLPCSLQGMAARLGPAPRPHSRPSTYRKGGGECVGPQRHCCDRQRVVEHVPGRDGAQAQQGDQLPPLPLQRAVNGAPLWVLPREEAQHHVAQEVPAGARRVGAWGQGQCGRHKRAGGGSCGAAC